MKIAHQIRFLVWLQDLPIVVHQRTKGHEPSFKSYSSVSIYCLFCCNSNQNFKTADKNSVILDTFQDRRDRKDPGFPANHALS